MSRLYEMATNPIVWPLEKIHCQWLWHTSTTNAEFRFLNEPDIPTHGNLSYIIQAKLATEEEIRMYMLFCYYAAQEEQNG